MMYIYICIQLLKVVPRHPFTFITTLLARQAPSLWNPSLVPSSVYPTWQGRVDRLQGYEETILKIHDNTTPYLRGLGLGTASRLWVKNSEAETIWKLGVGAWGKTTFWSSPEALSSSTSIKWCVFYHANLASCFVDGPPRYNEKNIPLLLSGKLKIQGSRRKSTWNGDVPLICF